MAAMTLKEALDHAAKCKEDGVISTSGKALITLAAHLEASYTHNDDLAVDIFAEMMKQKLAKSREKGRGGWDDPEQCSVEILATLVIEHVEKGDPVDIANLAMMVALREPGSKAIFTAMEGRLFAAYVQGTGE